MFAFHQITDAANRLSKKIIKIKGSRHALPSRGRLTLWTSGFSLTDPVVDDLKISALTAVGRQNKPRKPSNFLIIHEQNTSLWTKDDFLVSIRWGRGRPVVI